MNFREGKCPKCQGVLQVPEDRDSILCMYCGEKLDVSDILKQEEDTKTEIKTQEKPLDYEESLQTAMDQLPRLLLELENPLGAFKKDKYEEHFKSLYKENEDTLYCIWKVVSFAENPSEVMNGLATKFVKEAALSVESLPKKSLREQRLMDFNLSLAVYVIPIILEYKNKALDLLADQILEEWKKQFPKTNVGKSDYANIYSGFRKKLCYITTAVCETLGKGDDCYELTLLRHYRDYFLLNQSDGEEVINEYYNIAPTIVKRINKLSNSNEIYKAVWDDYLNPCVKLIEDNKNMECKDVYYKMVRDLQREYCH